MYRQGHLPPGGRAWSAQSTDSGARSIFPVRHHAHELIYIRPGYEGCGMAVAFPSTGDHGPVYTRRRSVDGAVDVDGSIDDGP